AGGGDLRKKMFTPKFSDGGVFIIIFGGPPWGAVLLRGEGFVWGGGPRRARPKGSIIIFFLLLSELFFFRAVFLVLLGALLRLTVVLGEIVQVPFILLPMSRRKILPPRKSVLGARDPALVIDRAVRENLEILALAHGLGFGAVECTRDRHAIHWLLLDSIDTS